MAQKPLTASLHTVTAVTRVARYVRKFRPNCNGGNEAIALTVAALEVLGYQAEADMLANPDTLIHTLPAVIVACIASVKKTVL